jgi:hypothetical protein
MGRSAEKIQAALADLAAAGAAAEAVVGDVTDENYWSLFRQPRSAWAHELDLRPWVESW